MGEGGLHVAEAAYFDILIGESECGNPRGGVCNLTLLFHPVRLCRPPLSFPTLARPCTIPPLPPFITPLPSLVRFRFETRLVCPSRATYEPVIYY